MLMSWHCQPSRMSTERQVSMSAVQSGIVEQLRKQLRSCMPHTIARESIPTRFGGLNKLLPDKGIRTGSVVEWISAGPGGRTSTIAFAAASGLLQQPGALAVVDPLHSLCTASLPQLGIPLSRLLLVRPQLADTRSTFISEYRLSGVVRSNALWALEQLARCTGVSVVLTWIDRLTSTAQRRLQLAVERSGTTVFLIRPSSVLNQPTWADLRFMVHTSCDNSLRQPKLATSSRLQVKLIRSRNSVHQQGHTLLECEHETGVVSEIL